MSIVLETLQQLITAHRDEIEEWFTEQYRQVKPLFYSSVDLRHSGQKLAPVDTNLFPAGFNNLSEDARVQAVKEMEAFFENYYPQTHNVLLIPEGHTRNMHYLDNVWIIKDLLEKSGRKVMLGNADLQDDKPYEVTSALGKTLTIYPVQRSGDTVSIGDFIPDLVLLNNDLTTGVPARIEHISQPVVPPLALGWHSRRKTDHFQSYNTVVRHFAQRFPFDGWLISTVFQHCAAIDFKARSGLECVALGVEQVLHNIRQKYEEYGITDKPYVFIKADMGTYGMGIMTAYSGEEIFTMNKDLRKKMGVVKGGVATTEVIIQEGIPTIDTVDGKTAEPFLYLVGNNPVGCIYRVNQERGTYGNLNSPGMTFEQMDCRENSSQKLCKLSPHGLVARLASLAAARESLGKHE